MNNRSLPHTDIEISAIGFGCMEMSDFYVRADPLTGRDSLEIFHRAIDLGVNFYDTSDVYGDGANEQLLSQFLRQCQKHLVVATKCGLVRAGELQANGRRRIVRNGRPSHIRDSCEHSLRRLGRDCIDLYYLHRIDPEVPLEESVGALSDLVRAGKVRAIGLSEPTANELRRAQRVHPISAVQSEYSLWTRLVEPEVLPTIREIGAMLVAYAPLGRGLIRRHGQLPALHADDFRLQIARFAPENAHANVALFETLEAAATATGMSVAQVHLRWLMDQGDDVIPIPGTTRIAHLEDNVAATQTSLPPVWKHRLANTFTPECVKGGRFYTG